MGVIAGWGMGMARLAAWHRAAQMNQGPLKLPRYTLAGWRHQFGSTATRWRQVHQEATELIAVHTMARLLETCYMYELVDDAPDPEWGQGPWRG